MVSSRGIESRVEKLCFSLSTPARGLAKLLDNAAPVRFPRKPNSWLALIDHISDWNHLKRELVSWNTVLDRPSVKKVRELVLT